MDYLDLLSFVGGTPSKIAKMLRVSTSAVAQWRATGKVPLLQAYRINRLTNGALKVGDDFFDGKDEATNAAREEHGAG